MDDNPVIARLVGHTVAEVERDLIIHTLSRHCGSRTRAAGVLGLSVRTLRNKIREYTALGIEVPAPGRTESRLRPRDMVPSCAGRPSPDMSLPTFWPADS